MNSSNKIENYHPVQLQQIFNNLKQEVTHWERVAREQSTANLHHIEWGRNFKKQLVN